MEKKKGEKPELVDDPSPPIENPCVISWKRKMISGNILKLNIKHQDDCHLFQYIRHLGRRLIIKKVIPHTDSLAAALGVIKTLTRLILSLRIEGEE